MKAVNVQYKYIHFLFGMETILIQRILIEKFFIEKPCQAVIFDSIKQCVFFGQLDRTLDSCDDNLRHIIGFRNKINCTELEGTDFGFFFRGQDNDWNASEFFVIVQFFEYLKAVYLWHKKIQKNNRESFVFFLDKGKCLFTVCGVMYLKLILKDMSEKESVDHFVIYDEYMTLSFFRFDSGNSFHFDTS